MNPDDLHALLRDFVIRKLPYYSERYPTLRDMSVVAHEGSYAVVTLGGDTGFPDTIPVRGIMVPTVVR